MAPSLSGHGGHVVRGGAALGTLPVRGVRNAGTDDMNLVIGTSRLRAADAAMAPGLEHDVVAGHHDDQAGVLQTYRMGMRPGIGEPMSGAPLCVAAVTGIVAWALGALVAEAAGADVALVAAAGTAAGVTDLALAAGLSVRRYLDVMAGDRGARGWGCDVSSEC